MRGWMGGAITNLNNNPSNQHAQGEVANKQFWLIRYATHYVYPVQFDPVRTLIDLNIISKKIDGTYIKQKIRT